MPIGIGKGVWQSVQGPLVNFADVVLNNDDTGSIVSARVKWDEDGDLYESAPDGTYSGATETWLDSGLNSQVWVERTIDNGSLTTDTIGAGRVVMSTQRVLGVTRAVGGLTSADGTVSFYDAASGGRLLRTRNWDLSALYL